MPPRTRLAILPIVLAAAGCAHQGQMPDGPDAARVPGHAGRTARAQVEKDPRFAFPRGDKRSLTIFLNSQTFEYSEDGRVLARGEVSTGSSEHPTPAGDFRVLSKDKNKRSGKYTNYFDQDTPMPYSLQFYGPYFVHEGWVPGYPDSHGCVRLKYEDARFLFDRMKVGDPVLIKRDGMARPAARWAKLPLVF